MTPEQHDVRRLFDEVAEACERCLEASHGREVGMSFAAAIRIVARLGTATGDADDPELVQLLDRLDGVLHNLSTGCLGPRYREGLAEQRDDRRKPLQPSSTATNMIYDTGGCCQRKS